MRAGSRYSRGLSFADNPWGEKAHQLVRTTSRLDDVHWGTIKEHAFAYIGATGEESDEEFAGLDDDARDAALNPHAFIELDW